MSNADKYIQADKYVIVNDNDVDLTPIVLRLPKPPNLKYIAGYGEYYEDQRFKREKIPRKLIDLEAKALQITKDKMSSNVNNVITLAKIQKTFWALLKERHKDLKKEIDFIRRVWWHRLNGYWFLNRGKPTYISGWHYYYLNFWTMDTNDGGNRPNYRDRDRKEFLFKLYELTTSETFERVDKEGYAIKESDGSYKMKRLLDNKGNPLRICFGGVQPKNRRSGNTNKALSDGLEMLTRTIGTDGAGCQSYSEDNAKSHFRDKLMPAYNKLPIWLKPSTSSGRTSDILRLDVGKNEYGEPSLETYADYATTASAKFYDGKKKIFLLTDESGKTHNVSVSKRHEVNQQTIAQGDGKEIHGFMEYPSTVDEITDGAFDYRNLSNNSNFYCRIAASGQTFSGLFLLFVPAYEGLDGYIDSYGYSVCGKLKDYQKKEGFTQTADEYLRGKRDALEAKGDPESKRALREARKLYPLKFEDCWLGSAGDIGFDINKIDERLAVLRRENNIIRGNLKWVDDVFGGEVEFIPDEENGKFRVSKMPLDYSSNKKVRVKFFNAFDQKWEDSWRPMHPESFVMGVDPFRVGGKAEHNIGKSLGKHSNLSDGGMAMLWNYDESIDGDKPKHEWDSYRFVLTYRERSNNTDDFNEEVLMASIWYGAMVFPEVNVVNTYEYFIKKGFGAFLLYDTDKVTGVIKPKPGMDSLERSKRDLFNMLRDYIDYRCHVEEHSDLLHELKAIKAPEEMRFYDILVSAGVALMGAKSSYISAIGRMEDKEYDLNDFLWT